MRQGVESKQSINTLLSSRITLFLVLLVFLVRSCFSYLLLLWRENHPFLLYKTRFYQVPHMLSSFCANTCHNFVGPPHTRGRAHMEVALGMGVAARVTMRVVVTTPLTDTPSLVSELEPPPLPDTLTGMPFGAIHQLWGWPGWAYGGRDRTTRASNGWLCRCANRDASLHRLIDQHDAWPLRSLRD
jgi:hypothetical protein